MSTQQITPRQPRTRVGAAFVALGVLVAIGLSVLILALTGAHRTPSPNPAITGAARQSQTAPAQGVAPAHTRHLNRADALYLIERDAGHLDTRP